jgi:hypothetical protein
LDDYEANFEKNQNQFDLKVELEKTVKQEKEYKEIKTQAKIKSKRKVSPTHFYQLMFKILNISAL